MDNQQLKNKNKIKRKTLIINIIGFSLCALFSCSLLVLWHLQNAVKIYPFIVCAVIFLVMLTFYFKAKLDIAIHRLLAIFLGVICGAFLYPKTEESIIEHFIYQKNATYISNITTISQPIIEKNILSNRLVEQITFILKNSDRDFAWRILCSSYKDSNQISTKRIILNIAKEINSNFLWDMLDFSFKNAQEINEKKIILSVAKNTQDERASLLFEKALEEEDIEIVLISVNFLQVTRKKQMTQFLQKKLPFLLKNLSTPNRPLQESIASYISIFLGKHALPEIFKVLSENKKTEYIDLLGRIGSKEANNTLIEIIKNTKKEHIKKEAIIALGLLRNLEALKFLNALILQEKKDSLYQLVQNAISNLKQSLNLSEKTSPKILEVTKNIRTFIKDLKSYDFETSCSMWISNGESPTLVHEMKGRIAYIKNNKFLLNQEVTLYQQGKQKGYIFSSFDGTYQWYYEGRRPFSKQKIKKISLQKFSFPKRPFDVWPVQRTGLMPGEDYIQTITTFLSMYDFLKMEDAENNDEVELTGVINKNKFMKYYASTGQIYALKDQKVLDLFVKSHAKLVLQVRKNDYFVLGWQIISQQQKAALFSAQSIGEGKIEFRIKKVSLNPSLKEDLFTIKANIELKFDENNLKRIFEARLKNRKEAMLFVNKILNTEE